MSHHQLYIAIFILFWIVSVYKNSCCEVFIYSHKLCQNSVKALNIINKIQNKLNNEAKSKQTIRFVKQIHEIYNEKQEIVYPTIKIKHKQKQIVYQNQLTLVQLQYWLQLHCYQQIPKCDSWMSQPIFPIHIQQSLQKQEHSKFLYFVYKNPLIKICTDISLPLQVEQESSLNSYNKIQNTISALLHQIPLFLRFNHNIRNYLLMNRDTTAVLLAYNPEIEDHVSIKNNMLDITKYIRNRDRRLSFHLSDNARNHLIFIIDRLDSKLVSKLFSFLNIYEVSSNQDISIVAFRFYQKSPNSFKLQGFQYKITQEMVLDDKFVFWLEQIVSSVNVPSLKSKLQQLTTQKQLEYCKESILIHQFQINNISSVVQNIKWLKLMNSIGRSQQSQDFEKQIFNRIVLFYNSSDDISNQTIGEVYNQLQGQIRQVIKQEIPKLWRQYELKQKYSIISKQFLYRKQLPFKSCKNGHELIRFSTVQHLIQHLIESEVLVKKAKQFNKDKKFINNIEQL